jgi:hypothetical protein
MKAGRQEGKKPGKRKKIKRKIPQNQEKIAEA